MTQATLAARPIAIAPWKLGQTFMLWGASALVAALIVALEAALKLFWNLVIPALPAILAFAPGVWRNLCPMASLSSRTPGRKLSPALQRRLMQASVILLLVIIPLRKVVLDASGAGTAAMILIAAGVAVVMGRLFDRKSGWCASLCPIRPVEALYGSAPAVVVSNAQCPACSRCVDRCPDTTADGIRIPSIALAGIFPGFIWGWFHVSQGSDVMWAYGLPAVCGALTLGWFLALRLVYPGRAVVRVFAALALITYYWYRIPALAGQGVFPGEGMLIDLSSHEWISTVSRVAVPLVFGIWLLAPARVRRPWCVRPAYEV